MNIKQKIVLKDCPQAQIQSDNPICAKDHVHFVATCQAGVIFSPIFQAQTP